MIRLRPLLVSAALVLVLSGCGEQSPPAVKVAFVGNDTCPTKDSTPYSPSPPGVNSQPPVGQAVDEMSHNHVAPPDKVTYLHDPPTSGCHYNLGAGTAPITQGVYDKFVAAEYWVHNLEHGYTAVLYNCPAPPGCAADFNKLHAWYNTHRSQPDPNSTTPYAKIIVLPWPSMKTMFAVVSWDWYLGMDKLDINTVERFYANHAGNSPEGNDTP